MVIRLKAAKAPAVVRSICTPRLHTLILNSGVCLASEYTCEGHDRLIHKEIHWFEWTLTCQWSFGTRPSCRAVLRVKWDRQFGFISFKSVNPHFDAPNLPYTSTINSKNNFLPKVIAVMSDFLRIPSDKWSLPMTEVCAFPWGMLRNLQFLVGLCSCLWM